MNAVLPIAALVAAVLLLGGKKASAAAAPAAPKGTVSVGPPTLVRKTPAAKKPAAAKPAAKKPAIVKSDALQAAELAERQLGAPNSAATITAQNNRTQTIPGVALPAGYSRVEATRRAQPMADQIRTKKSKYDRAALQTFQTFAGLKGDGLYGPQTRNALMYFGAKNVPAALFKGTNTAYKAPAGG